MARTRSLSDCARALQYLTLCISRQKHMHEHPNLKGGPAHPAYTLGPGPAVGRGEAQLCGQFAQCCFTNKCKLCRTAELSRPPMWVVRSHTIMRIRLHKVCNVVFRFSLCRESSRSLRVITPYTQDIGEVCVLYIYIYIYMYTSVIPRVSILLVTGAEWSDAE